MVRDDRIHERIHEERHDVGPVVNGPDRDSLAVSLHGPEDLPLVAEKFQRGRQHVGGRVAEERGGGIIAEDNAGGNSDVDRLNRVDDSRIEGAEDEFVIGKMGPR